MKREKRPWILLYLLVGVLVLSTGLNFYFLLQLDNRVGDQEMLVELQDNAPENEALTLRLPMPDTAPPDTAQAAGP